MLNMKDFIIIQYVLSIIQLYFSQEKLNFICDLLYDKKYIEQIMLSNNINFKIQIKKYGGFGYRNLFQNYMKRIINKADLSKDDVARIFNKNLVELLTWWEAPKKQIKKINYFKCSK